MTEVLIGTSDGCLTFDESGRKKLDFNGRAVSAPVRQEDGTCLAVVSGRDLWQRDTSGCWSLLHEVAHDLVAIVPVN